MARLPTWAKERAALWGAGALFLLLAWPGVRGPGLWQDEAYESSVGMEAALGLSSSSDWTLGGFPLRAPHPYHFAAFAAWWSGLAFALGGVSVAVLRGSALLLMLGLLAALHELALAAWGRRAAAAAALLLATSPLLVAWGPLAYNYNELFVCLFGVLALALASRGRPGAAAFAFGFLTAVNSKAAAYLLVFPLVALVFGRKGERPSARAAGAFLLGAAPFLLFQATHGFPTLGALLRRAAAPPGGGDNGAWAANAALRLRQLRDLLSGSEPSGVAGGADATAALLPAAALLAFAGLAVRRPRRRAEDALLLLLPLLFLCTLASPSTLDAPHLLVLAPFVFLLLGAAFEALAAARGVKAAAAALLLLLASQLRADLAYRAALARTGGSGLWSDAVYALAAHLDREGLREPLCLSWGMSLNVYLLTSGRVRPRDEHNWRAGLDDALRGRYARDAAQPGLRYLTVAEGVAPNLGVSRGYVAALEAALGSRGRRLSLEKEFPDRRGAPVYRLWSVR